MAARRAELLPRDVSVLRLPFSMPRLLATVAALTGSVQNIPADPRFAPDDTGAESNSPRLSP
jgi:ABC-type transport system involved in cytochrome c biogenesis permease component